MKKEYLLFFMIPVSQLMIVVGNYRSLGSFNLLGYLGLLLSAAADVVLFYILLHVTKKEELERELEEIRFQRETERMRAEMLEERKKKLLSMREDFERQFCSINEELEQGRLTEAEQNLERLQEKLEGTKPTSWCQNWVVNAVLDEKEKVCRQLGAEWQAELFVPQNLTIEPLHLCSIFSNLLDNALEAVEDTEEQKRRIQVRGEMKGKYLLVKVENTSTRPHAERRKREGRGNGTKILKMIAEKYDGTYTAEYKDGMYTAVVAVKGG